MTLVSYTVPVLSSSEDNNTKIQKALILIKDCSQYGDPDNDCLGFNFNRCPNDSKYCQPFILGDKIYGQLKFDQKLYAISAFQIINTATGANIYSSSFVTLQTGIDELNNSYINYVIDTGHASFASVECFYTMIALTPRQGEGTIYYTSEPYCIVQCNENTLLILGEYPNGYDCYGGYYGSLSGGVLPGASIYIPQVRIRGVVESDNFDFEETINNKKKIKSKQFERFILYSKDLPYYVVRQVAVCFNSKSVTIDGVVYSGTIKLTKNNDEGSMWYLKENIFRECDEINFTCE